MNATDSALTVTVAGRKLGSLRGGKNAPAGVAGSCAVEAELLLHLGEIDERKLYLDRAFSSMFAFCTRELGRRRSWSRVRRIPTSCK